jgi:hypothetical protein
VLALASTGLTAYTALRGDGSTSTPAAQGAGEVFLEPARYPGAEPFSSDVNGLAPGITPVVLPASTTAAPTTAAPTTAAPTTSAAAATTVPPTTANPAATTTAPPIAVASNVGTTPGLYGGTRAIGSCDVDAIDRFLAQNPDKAKAWADAQGIAPNEISAFLRRLTPVVLLADTRVTNHGYRNGVATPLQSVLQAGTAVLVDPTGVPRVKCACGNPLKAPVARTQAVTYTGTTWDGFDPKRVTAVTPGATVETLVIQDILGGPPIARPVGTTGPKDTTAPADLAAKVVPVKVSIPPTTAARGTTSAAPSTSGAATTTRAGGTTSAGPTTTVLPSSGDFCTKVKAYEAIADRDYALDSNWNLTSGKTAAEFGAFLDAALRELASVAPTGAAADMRKVSDWWQPTMGPRDLFGAGVTIPQDVISAIEKMNAAINACG